MTRVERARKQMGVPEPTAKIVLRPERSPGHAWRVYVFRTDEQMRRYISHIRPDKRGSVKDAWGFTDERTQTIALSLKSCTDNCLGHELLHLTCWYARQIGLRAKNCMTWGHPTHERIAEVLGDLLSQFWKKYSGLMPRTNCWGFRGRP